MNRLNLTATSAALTLFFCWSTTYGQSINLRIKSNEVKVFDSIVTIADVADIESNNARLSEKIGALDLDMLLNDGEQMTFNKQQIELRILVSEFRSDRINVRGNSKVTVTRAANVHPAKALKQAAIAAIAEQFGLEQTDIRVSLNEKTISKAMTELASSIDDAMVVLPADLPLGDSSIRFVYRDQDEIDQSLPLKCRVTVMTEMVVAKKTIPQGETVSAEDVKTVKRPLDDKKVRPASLKSVVGKTTRSNISVHTVIRIADLTETVSKPVVKRNDIVDVLYRKGALSMRLRNAKVLNSGRVGDRVEFINPNSQKKVVASVVSESLIEVR